MADQPRFADLDYQHKRHKTRRERFLEQIKAPGALGETGTTHCAPLAQSG